MRATLRKEYANDGFTRDLKKKFGIPAGFSTEPLRYPESGATCDEPPTLAGLNCAGYGSSVCVTAPFGLFAASAALRHLAGGWRGPPVHRTSRSREAGQPQKATSRW